MHLKAVPNMMGRETRRIVMIIAVIVDLIWAEELRWSGVKEGEGRLAGAGKPASHLEM